MYKVFVSHAAADKSYADRFVDDLLVRGAGLNPRQDVFYSSGEDTGVGSGRDLMATVRMGTGSSGLIVALVTPTFQTRPVCVAELGAAWAMDKLFPVMSPGMERSSLEGVLPGLAIRPSNDSATIDELAERIRGTGHDVNVQSWGAGREKWLAYLEATVNPVASLVQPTLDDVRKIKASLDNARSALQAEVARTEELKVQLEKLKSAKDSSEVTKALLPAEDYARFEALLSSAKEAMAKLPPIVTTALWHDMSEGSMPWPRWADDPDEHGQALEAKRDGYLTEDWEEQLVPDAAFPAVAKAQVAIAELQKFLKETAENEFIEWFEDEYEVPADLTKRASWQAVI